MDTLDALAFFIRIVEKQGVAAAGRDFGLSPATASERLAALEARYGATLLNRTTRSISLTDAGRTLLDGARSLVSDAQDLKDRIHTGNERLSGTIRLSAPHDLGEHTIAPLLDSFMALHPHIRVELLLSDSYMDIAGQGLDMAIRHGALKDSSLMVKKLGDNRRVICAAPAYLNAHGTPKHPDDLIHHNCLIMQFGQTIDREWSFLIDGHRCDIAVSGNRNANSGALVRRWCLDGHGIALKSIWDVWADLKAGRLIEILGAYAPTNNASLQIAYPKGSRTVKRIQSLMDFLNKHLPRPPSI
jgi:DNA-binding transcriptional LysR family regulator